MKKAIILAIFMASFLGTLPTQAKLYWESEETWRSYYPYVTVINNTNYNLEVGTTTFNNAETEWLSVGKNESLKIVINFDFKDLFVRLAHDNKPYIFTNDVKTDLEEVQEILSQNPHTAIKMNVIIQSKSKLSQSQPTLTVFVEKEVAVANRVANYVVAKKISRS